MKTQGTLKKMPTELDPKENVVQYYLPIGATKLPINNLVGTQITLKYLNEIKCLSCGMPTKKSFFQGYCYKCFITAPETADCILRPELCKAHEGKGRDVEWEKAHHNQPHCVYLALSSDIKVGVTRDIQIPTRWIDQGASQAIILAETPNRYLSGIIEVGLKAIMSDRTQWQKMLKNDLSTEDLLEKKQEVSKVLPPKFRAYLTPHDEVLKINYPVEEYPEKVKSMTFDKVGEISGKLMGIKGQYLIFEGGMVFNVRRHGGYKVSFEAT